MKNYFLLSIKNSFSQTKITGYFDGKIETFFIYQKKSETAFRINDSLGKEFDVSLHL